jgi:hypothetical protein
LWLFVADAMRVLLLLRGDAIVSGLFDKLLGGGAG